MIRDHAWMLLGLGGIDASDAGVMMRAAHHFQMEHAREVAVGEICVLPVTWPGDVGARAVRWPICLQIVVALVGEEFFGESVPSCFLRRASLRIGAAAASTALMIGS